MTELETYEQLFKLANAMRTAHWEAVKYRSKQAAEKEKQLGFKIDKLLRQENKIRTQDNLSKNELQTKAS